MAKDSQITVVMVPFLAQGHLGQHLHLSRLISSYNINVHYVSTTTHLRQALKRHQGWDLHSFNNIHFHEFSVPAFDSPQPNPNSSVKFPTHLQPAFDSSVHLREPFCKLLTSLSTTSRRIIIVHDSLMGYVVQDFVTIPNAEAYTFQSNSALLIFSYYWELLGRPIVSDDEILKQLPSLQNAMSSDFFEFADKQLSHLKNNSGDLYNTSRAIEGRYFELLEKLEVDRKHWAIGPFNPVEISKKSNQQRHKCLEWLDKQFPNSVIYVSFGTTTTLTDEQIQAIAIGLENSGQKFIWVVREADKGDIFTGDVRESNLPKGYEDRIINSDQGMIIRDWAPQLEILAHSSTGGFMSHCGWNSFIESLTMGVPIATWPMHSDQPTNAVIINKLLKIGTVVKEWVQGNNFVESLTIENAVKKLMVSKEGDEMRKRAADLRDGFKKAVADGGATRKELDSFIAHITRS